MNSTLLLTISFAIGLLVGLVFFAGLWWTIRTGLHSARPATLFLGSLLLRTTIVLTGFYFVVVVLNKTQHEHSLSVPLSCFFGFLLARFLVQRILSLRRYAQVDEKSSTPRAENGY